MIPRWHWHLWMAELARAEAREILTPTPDWPGGPQPTKPSPPEALLRWTEARNLERLANEAEARGRRLSGARTPRLARRVSMAARLALGEDGPTVTRHVPGGGLCPVCGKRWDQHRGDPAIYDSEGNVWGGYRLDCEGRSIKT